MTKKILLLCILLIAGIFVTALCLKNSADANSFNANGYGDVRKLTEVNTVGKADAYPWISPDAKRLYFTKQTTSGTNIFKASRKDKYSDFGDPEQVEIGRPFNSDSRFEIISFWLTSDELEMYVTLSGGEIYYYEKEDNQYKNQRKITIKGDYSGFIAGITLTPDKEEMYLYNNADEQKILLFDRVNDFKYKFKKELKVPNGLKPAPGKLSYDGLYFFFSLETEDGDEAIYYFKRSSLDESFSNLYLVGGSINDKGGFQPSVSKGGEIMVFVRGYDAKWENNDIYTAIKDGNDIDKKIR